MSDKDWNGACMYAGLIPLLSKVLRPFFLYGQDWQLDFWTQKVHVPPGESPSIYQILEFNLNPHLERMFRSGIIPSLIDSEPNTMVRWDIPPGMTMSSKPNTTLVWYFTIVPMTLKPEYIGL